jgi:hypothetical protein
MAPVAFLQSPVRWLRAVSRYRATTSGGPNFAYDLLQRMVTMSALPLSFALAGPLADRVFEPLLAHGGALAGTVGRLLGTGHGRGIGLMFELLGLTLILTALVAGLSPRLRNLERELPDASREEGAEEERLAEPRARLDARSRHFW